MQSEKAPQTNEGRKNKTWKVSKNIRIASFPMGVRWFQWLPNVALFRVKFLEFLTTAQNETRKEHQSTLRHIFTLSLCMRQGDSSLSHYLSSRRALYWTSCPRHFKDASEQSNYRGILRGARCLLCFIPSPHVRAFPIYWKAPKLKMKSPRHLVSASIIAASRK